MTDWNIEHTSKWFVSHTKSFHITAISTGLLALLYITWRYTSSINREALWFSVPLLIAETYGIIDLFLFILLIWQPKQRTPPVSDGTPTVDVFITTYNESREILEPTVKAAVNIEWKNKTVYILDDGNRSEIKSLSDEKGCIYITRGPEWDNKPRHAKAGNVNNALLQTAGDFVLILDADQIPKQEILNQTIGYFNDPKVALVQTPQYFYNIPKGDPFGVDAPLFYGPIMQGKDGWNAAFFCGSNGILRREALMQAGIIRYVAITAIHMKKSLNELLQYIKRIHVKTRTEKEIFKILQGQIRNTLYQLKKGKPLETLSDQIKEAVHSAIASISNRELLATTKSLKSMADEGDKKAQDAYTHIISSLKKLGDNLSAQESLGLSPNLMEEINMTMPNEAIPIQALSTISITEDMATALFLHSQGWKSVYHPEILAMGLSPEDLGTMLNQRLRWAQGTIQVFKRENPLTIQGLTLGQRLMYFSSIYSYFSGFFSFIFLCAPIIYLFFNIAPVSAWSFDFFIRFIPFYLANKIFYKIITHGIPTWRGEQYNMALFPLWIKAVISVYTNRKITFRVTPKERQSGNYVLLVWPQLLIIVLTASGIIFQAWHFMYGNQFSIQGFIINSFWGIYNIVVLSVIIKAAFYKFPTTK